VDRIDSASILLGECVIESAAFHGAFGFDARSALGIRVRCRLEDSTLRMSVTDSSAVVMAEMHSRFIPASLYEAPFLDSDARISEYRSGVLGGQPDLGRKMRKASRSEEGIRINNINLLRSKRHRGLLAIS